MNIMQIPFCTLFKYSKLRSKRDRLQQGRISAQHFGIFRHNKTYLGMNQDIQYPGIYRTQAYLEPEAYSEPWCIQDLNHIHSLVKYVQ